MKKILGYATLLLATTTLTLGGCADDPTIPPAPPIGEGGTDGEGGADPGVPQGMAMVRVVHGASDAPAVDIYAEGIDGAVVEDLSFGDASDYLVIPPGIYNFQIRATPSSDADAVVYETGPIEIEEGDKYTTIAAGLLDSTEVADKFRVLAYNESFGPSGSGNAIVRVVHAGPDAPSVGIDLHDDDPTSPEVTGLDRFTASDPAGIPLTAGEELQIGIAANGEKVTAFTTPELPEGAQLFVIATGLTQKLAREGDGFALLAVGPDGSLGFIRQNPVVYALHASPDAPTVDVFAGDAEIVDGLAFGQLSGPLQLPPGNYDLSFYGTAAGSERPASPPAADAETGSLEAGERYLTVATGLLGGGANAFQLASYAEGFELTGDDPRIRLVHSSPDAPAVDIGVLNVENVVNPVLVSDVSFPAASDASGLLPGLGTIPFGVTPAGANDTIVASFHVTTAPGLRAFALAAGALDQQNGQSFRLLVVDTAMSPWSVATVHPQP